MAQNPETHRHAQAEVDQVVGHDRLPSVDDIPNLPYIDAIVKETMRWHPSLPLGSLSARLLCYADANSIPYRSLSCGFGR